MADDDLRSSSLHVPDRSLLCGYCDGYVLVYGERRVNENGTVHACQGWKAAQSRKRGLRGARITP